MTYTSKNAISSNTRDCLSLTDAWYVWDIRVPFGWLLNLLTYVYKIKVSCFKKCLQNESFQHTKNMHNMLLSPSPKVKKIRLPNLSALKLLIEFANYAECLVLITYVLYMYYNWPTFIKIPLRVEISTFLEHVNSR